VTDSVAPRPLIAGNWKMNGVGQSLDQARALAAAIETRPPAARVALCAPATLIARLADCLAGFPIAVGGQDCRPEPSGAFTGDISPEMLVDAGATMVILGHSERRALHGETDAMVAAKVEGALRVGLEPIVCVGESLDQRRAGSAVDVVRRQLVASLPADLRGRAFCVAYEPIWAIGTGETPTMDQIEEIHRAIRADLRELFGDWGAAVPILYGGSVNPANAAEVLRVPEVGGALVGGASLKATDFAAICAAA
jgi:triosephosphate isomerase